MAAFERMEEKVLQMEARSQAAAEIGGSSLDDQFAQLEAGSDVDDELSAMKAQLSGASPSQQALPASEEGGGAQKSEVDDELDRLRNELNNM
jgi:phage shock protein A